MASSDLQRISTRYARAAFDMARAQNALDAMEGDFSALLPLLHEGALKSVIANPLLNRAQKAQAMDAVLARGNAHALTRQFFNMLAVNNRLDALPVIIEQFNALLLAFRGEAVVEVTSAIALSDAQYAALTAALSKATGRKVRLLARTDETLLGGLALSFDGKRLDYSLSSRLMRLETAMKAA